MNININNFTVIPQATAREEKGIEAVPDELLVEWSLKLFALMNLTWDYVDTICDLCVSMKLGPTKKLVREIRSVKAEYDRFRWAVMSQQMVDFEQRHGLKIEEIFADDFRKLTFGLEQDVNKLDLIPEHKMLVLAVQQALTLLDATKMYARWCDARIAEMGVWAGDCCMVQTEFLRLYGIVPEFAGDCYQPDLSARKLTAGILRNRLIEISIENLLDEKEELNEMMLPEERRREC